MYQARVRARALVKFTPIHHWEGGELKSGQKRVFLGKSISVRFCMITKAAALPLHEGPGCSASSGEAWTPRITCPQPGRTAGLNSWNIVEVEVVPTAVILSR